MGDEKGYLALILHAHLPYVRHPEHPDFFEETWLYEAITETYIPLIQIFRRLANEGIKFRITMSITPPLASMLQDSLLKERYLRHIERLIELAEREVDRTRWLPELNENAKMYLERFREARHLFADEYQCNLLAAFIALQDRGCLELITIITAAQEIMLNNREFTCSPIIF